MLTSVLIANRGEIARRIIRTCRRLGVRTIAVYSDADARSAHVRDADEAVHIGQAAAKESYLRGEKVIAAAKQSGAEAIHPGYGFLSENADFAQSVIDAGLIWIGPRPESIRAMGLKDAAKKLMAEAGVPTTPGYLGEDQSDARLQQEADSIGYPVLIKAVAGGGGKGMRKVDKAKDFKAALGSAKREAQAAFGDDRVLLETYVQRPRHIEVQVFGDMYGNVVHLFERDCSLQRRHQKVIEEAPAPGMDEATRASLCAAAVRAARAVDYVGAGTVEFIADASAGLHADRIWFMEMNTRLQVEHPVTEAITGQDLVEWQLRVASGEKLPLAQEDLSIGGCAIEARLYAEDSSAGFLPSVGRLQHFFLPAGVRVDSGYDPGETVSPNYDPMLAKIIAAADTRDRAIAALAEACAQIEVWPVKTNAGFLVRCLEAPDFIGGAIDTSFIPARFDALAAAPAPSERLLEAAAQYFVDAVAGAADEAEAFSSPWTNLKGFRLNSPSAPRVHLRWKEHRFSVEPDPWAAPHGQPMDGALIMFEAGEPFLIELDSGARAEAAADAGDGAILSPMPGKIVSVNVKAGAKVKRGDALLVVEAMKMEHTLPAPFDGVVAEIKFKAGDQVAEGALLAKLEKA